ncbi:MAG: MlaD family protein [Pseudomonadota bacterium]
MSKPVNKTLVGGFVLGAVGILVAAFFALGLGDMFQPTTRLVLYFSGSVSGLNVGSPVVFRGVPVGEVESINIRWDRQAQTFQIPVVIRTRADAIAVARAADEPTRNQILQDLIDKGLRGQLAMQSFVTGQLMVMLDFFPDTKVILHDHAEYLQIPTVPSQLEQLSDTLKTVPVQEIADEFLGAVKDFRAFISAPELLATTRTLQATLEEYRILGKQFNEDLPVTLAQFDKTMASFETTSEETGKAMVAFREVSSSTGEAMDVFSAASAKTGVAMDMFTGASESTGEAMESLVSTFGSGSRTIVDLQDAMREITSAARSIRVFMDYLERHPDALLTGKQ